jgi:hypothetical protein
MNTATLSAISDGKRCDLEKVFFDALEPFPDSDDDTLLEAPKQANNAEYNQKRLEHLTRRQRSQLQKMAERQAREIVEHQQSFYMQFDPEYVSEKRLGKMPMMLDNSLANVLKNTSNSSSNGDGGVGDGGDGGAGGVGAGQSSMRPVDAGNDTAQNSIELALAALGRASLPETMRGHHEELCAQYHREYNKMRQRHIAEYQAMRLYQLRDFLNISRVVGPPRSVVDQQQTQVTPQNEGIMRFDAGDAGIITTSRSSATSTSSGPRTSTILAQGVAAMAAAMVSRGGTAGGSGDPGGALDTAAAAAAAASGVPHEFWMATIRAMQQQAGQPPMSPNTSQTSWQQQFVVQHATPRPPSTRDPRLNRDT